MRKVLLVLSIFVFGIIFISCSDNGTCYCESGLESIDDKVYYDTDSEFCNNMDEIERITGGRCQFDRD